MKTFGQHINQQLNEINNDKLVKEIRIFRYYRVLWWDENMILSEDVRDSNITLYTNTNLKENIDIQKVFK